MKRVVLRFLQTFGVLSAARAASAGMARVLMYHNFCTASDQQSDDVNQATLRSQLEHLRRHFQVVPLQVIADSLAKGKKLPRGAVVLTVDDGRRNCYQYLFPLLQEFKIPATLFVVSSFIRGEDWIWTDKILWLANQPGRPRELAPDVIDRFFAGLNLLHPQARNTAIQALAASMGISIPPEAPANFAPCSWSQLREMADSGLVEIGSHTVTHPIFSSISDEESWHELTTSRMQIEEGLGRQVNAFCYPNGQPQDYRPSQVRQVIDAGYTTAVVARFGMVGASVNPYEVPRIGVSGRSDALTFAKHLDGLEYYQQKLRESLRI